MDYPASDKKLELAYTASDNKGKPDFYVFNHDKHGFVIAGGDETAKPVLAYSDESLFNVDSLPDNFRYWLRTYQRQIEYAKDRRLNASTMLSTGVSSSSRWLGGTKSKANRMDVNTLVKAQWGQSSPFNDKCPEVDNRTTMAGCVATAMAQVMKYHKWPAQGMGSHSYYDTVSKQQLSSDFSQHTYLWTNMPDKYTSTSTSSQMSAVARLMYDCGIGVEMQYDPNGSGAWTENVTYALVNYFGYDEGARQIMHDYVSDEEWEEYIYNELSNNRPVIFSGADEEGTVGHCFVCDGYRKSADKYHFNWGWNGSGNCYCSLSAIGAAGDDFNYMQDIIIGIQPPTTGIQHYFPDIYAYDGDMNMAVTDSSGYLTYTIKYLNIDEFDTIYNQIYNHSYRDVDVLFAMRYTNQATGESYILRQNSENNKYSFPSIYPLDDDYTLHGDTQIVVKDVVLPDMPAGEYRVTLAVKDYLDKDNDDDSLWFDVRTYTMCENYVTVNYVPTSVTSPTAFQPAANSLGQLKFNLAGQLSTPLPGQIYIQEGRKYRR